MLIKFSCYKVENHLLEYQEKGLIVKSQSVEATKQAVVVNFISKHLFKVSCSTKMVSFSKVWSDSYKLLIIYRQFENFKNKIKSNSLNNVYLNDDLTFKLCKNSPNIKNIIKILLMKHINCFNEIIYDHLSTIFLSYYAELPFPA